jgi:F-type H+-transporting ATPase subunit c
MVYAVALALAVGLGVPIAVLAAATAQGRAAASGLESIARQPESTSDIQRVLLISLAFIESLVIYALLMFILLYGKLPGVLEVLQQPGAGG